MSIDEQIRHLTAIHSRLHVYQDHAMRVALSLAIGRLHAIKADYAQAKHEAIMGTSTKGQAA